jgi:hypothetical protein
VFNHHAPDLLGIRPVLVEPGNSQIGPEWHLHQDFVVTLGLRREGDVWVRPDEGYMEIARLERGDAGHPRLLEVRASHLRDYLCARGMGLYVSSYRSRVEVVESVADIDWNSNPMREESKGVLWEGGIREIHEGGEPFGQETVVLHITRTDVDSGEDVPSVELDDPVGFKETVVRAEGRKVFRVSGRVWRNEWVDPASTSPIVRDDHIPATVFFITDAVGHSQSKDTLVGAGQWLWFRPEVMMALAHRRGGSLGWYTRDTGSVACVPDRGVHFGVNALGLVNVYAKDIALLPDWQQKIWSGFNVGPEGRVSEELLASQGRGEPADTQAPESYLAPGLTGLNKVAKARLGIEIVKSTEHTRDILTRSHRFRAIDKAGLFSLAKDLARLTAESFDTTAIQSLAPPPKGNKLGSLKSIEGLFAKKVGPDAAHSAMSPLHWIYNLRLADAHLPGEDADESLKSLGVDATAPYVIQGYQLMRACVGSIYTIIEILDGWDARPVS